MNLIACGSDVLASAAVFVLVVLRLSLVVNLMGLFNFAHGELLLVGAVASYTAQQLGANPIVGLLAAPIAGCVVGVALDRTLLRHFYEEPATAILLTAVRRRLPPEARSAAGRGRYRSPALLHLRGAPSETQAAAR